MGLTAYGEAGAIATSLAGFPLVYLPAALLLSCGNYGLRFLKWQYYLRCLDIRVPGRQSLGIFLSGLTLSITPGKVGELLKSYLLRELYGVPIATSAPIVLAERLTDLVAIILLCAGGALAFDYDPRALLVAGVLVAGLIAAAGSRRAARLVARQVGRWRRLEGLEAATMAASESAVAMMRPGRLVIASLLSVAAWFCECLELHLILAGLGFPLDTLAATFVYAFATLIGALTMLPGGLITTEGSMTGLLQRFGVAKSPAAAATLVVRACTLWFAVGLGVVSLMATARSVEAQCRGNS